jgi:hypothetical protein
VLRVSNGVIGLGVLQPTEWQRIGDQIKAAFIFAWPALRKGVVGWSLHASVSTEKQFGNPSEA